MAAVHQIDPAHLLGRPLDELEESNAPGVLFAAGDLPLARRAGRIAVIGSRAPSAAGLRRCRRLVGELAGHGATVVSGLAAGIDTMAHAGVLAAGGRTMAVLGTPLDRVYPASNVALQREIASRHLAISPFTPGSAVWRANFPLRNRLMALLAEATVIVEAGETSGCVAQGWEAIRLGRPLFILHSLAAAPQLKWPARMIEHGAQALTSVDSILAALPGLLGRAARTAANPCASPR